MYIGKTTNSLKKRFQQHIAAAVNEHKTTRLYEDIRKYGRDNFTITKWITDKTEQELIQELKPYYNKQLQAPKPRIHGKDVRQGRNKRIWELRQEGLGVDVLSKRFNLSTRMIYKILDTINETNSYL
jgi:erythromycin esterase-like protein